MKGKGVKGANGVSVSLAVVEDSLWGKRSIIQMAQRCIKCICFVPALSRMRVGPDIARVKSWTMAKASAP